MPAALGSLPKFPADPKTCPNLPAGPRWGRLGGQVRGPRAFLASRLLFLLSVGGTRQPRRALSGSGRRGGVVSPPVPTRGTRTHRANPPHRQRHRLPPPPPGRGAGPAGGAKAAPAKVRVCPLSGERWGRGRAEGRAGGRSPGGCRRGAPRGFLRPSRMGGTCGSGAGVLGGLGAQGQGARALPAPQPAIGRCPGFAISSRPQCLPNARAVPAGERARLRSPARHGARGDMAEQSRRRERCSPGG